MKILTVTNLCSSCIIFMKHTNNSISLKTLITYFLSSLVVHLLYGQYIGVRLYGYIVCDGGVFISVFIVLYTYNIY